MDSIAFRLFILYLLAICTFGCSKPQPKATVVNKPANTKNFDVLEQTAKGLGWKTTLSMNPFPPASRKKIAFGIKLADAQGSAIDGAQVQISLIMPLMNMGKNEFTAAPAGDGAYSGYGTFPMEGIWIVQTNVVKNNHKARFEFEVHLNE